MLYGTFINESAMWKALESVPFGRPGTEVYVAVPATDQQIRRLSGTQADLQPFIPYARQGREHSEGILRLMQTAPRHAPLSLGELGPL